MNDDVLTRNDDGELSVRTVSSTESSTVVNPNDVYTRDTNGNLCIRTTGSGGGSDPHNLGYFATQAALEEAYPTAEAGDWAIVGETDTVWIWDEDSSAWVDSDQKGQVVSVNGKTGTVVLTATDVDAMPQYSSMPTAAVSNEGDIVQFTGTTDATYTNGYVYKCTAIASDATITQSSSLDITFDKSTFETQITTTGQYTFQYDVGIDAWLDWDNNQVNLADYGISYSGVPVNADTITVTYTAASYSWVQTNVQPAPSGLPDQTGQSGKFLTTDGTDASWGTISALQNQATGTNSLVIDNAVNYSGDWCVTIGATYNGSVGNVIIGKGSAGIGCNYCVAIGADAYAYDNRSIAIGKNTMAHADGAIILGTDSTRDAQGYATYNSDANTFKVANGNGTFEIMNATGNLPADRLASTTGLTDGNYKLRLTMADGVPTLSWVAE